MDPSERCSHATITADRRLDRRGLLRSEALPPTEGGRPRRLYRLTEDGRRAHLDWVCEPVAPETVSQDLGMHLLRFVMMAQVLPEEAVVGFLDSLRTALAGFVAALERQVGVHRASLAWAEQAIARMAADSARG